jgi:hypothetical protein
MEGKIAIKGFGSSVKRETGAHRKSEYRKNIKSRGKRKINDRMEGADAVGQRKIRKRV